MPHTSTIQLNDGRTGILEMPDLYELLCSVGTVPDPSIAAVLRLLEGTGALEQQNLIQRLQGQKEFWVGLYKLASLCLVEPRLRLDVSDKAPLLEGELTPKDLTLNQVQGIYYQFFLGGRAAIGQPKSNNPGGLAPVAPASDDVPAAPEPDRRSD